MSSADGIAVVNLEDLGITLALNDVIVVAQNINNATSNSAPLTVSYLGQSAAPAIAEPVYLHSGEILVYGAENALIALECGGTTKTAFVSGGYAQFFPADFGAAFADGATLTATQTETDRTESAPVTATVSALDTSAAPVIQTPVNAGAETLTVHGVPGAALNIAFSYAGGSGHFPAQVGPDGVATSDLSALGILLLEGDTLTAIQTEPGKLQSAPHTVTVQAAPPSGISAAPVIQTPIYADDTAITVQGVPGAQVDIVYHLTTGSATTFSGQLDANGLYILDLSAYGIVCSFGESFSATQTEPGKLESAPYTVTVVAQETSAAPAIQTPVYESAETLTVHGVPGATLDITFVASGGGTAHFPAQVGPDGSVTVDLHALAILLVAGDPLSATQVEPGKLESAPHTVTVEAAPPATSATPAIQTPVCADHVTVAVAGVPGAEITLSHNGVSLGSALAVPAGGTVSFDLTTHRATLAEGDTLSATQAEPGKLPSAPHSITVQAATLSEISTPPTPPQTPPKPGDTSITLTGTPGAEVSISLNGNTPIISTIGPDGTVTIPLPTLNAGDTLTIIQTEPGKLPSAPIVITIADSTVSATPFIETVDPSDDFINVRGVPGATITLYRAGIAYTQSLVAQDGYARIDVHEKEINLAIGLTLAATQTEPDKETSPAHTVTVGEDSVPLYTGDGSDNFTGTYADFSTSSFTAPSGPPQGGEDGEYAAGFATVNASATLYDAPGGTAVSTASTGDRLQVLSTGHSGGYTCVAQGPNKLYIKTAALDFD